MSWPAIYMDAEIKPNRSLSRRGFYILLGIISAANLASGIMFLIMGAHLVPIFLGLDVAAIAVALVASNRSGRIIERVRVTGADVVITHETPKAARVVWESPTAFTRVSTERDEDDKVTSLTLALSGRRCAVAEALSPGERGDFARALEDAIWRAKRGG